MMQSLFSTCKPKILVTIWAFCLPLLVCSQNGLSWSPAVPAAAASLGSSSPRIALLGDGRPVVVWGKPGTTPQIWCARWDSTAFSSPVQVDIGSVPAFVYDFGGLAVATAGQRVFVVFENFNQGIFLARSDDSGATWQPPVTVFSTPPGMGTTISAIATDAAGNPIVTFLLQTSAETDAHVHLARSLDGGLTFPVLTNASAPAGDNGQACECCYQDILFAGDDTVFVAFRANRTNLRDMWVTRSIDGASTFDAACDADSQDWVISACPFSGPQLARLAGDSLIAVWMSRGSGSTRVYVSTLHSGTMEKGSEFGFPGSSGAAGFNQNHPDVAGQQDTIAMIWEESGFSGTGQDLVCAFSTSGAGGLATNMAPMQAIGTQSFPQIAYSEGIFHLLYVNGSQGLAYRQGTVVTPSATGEVLSGKDQLRVWPNPAGETLFFETELAMPESAFVRVFNAVGRVVLEDQILTLNKRGSFETGQLAPGVYSIQLFAGVKVFAGTFVKQ